MYEYRQPPIRYLYIAYQLLKTVLFRLPFWIIISIPRSLRPHRSWSFQQSVFIKLAQCLGPSGYVQAKTGFILHSPDHLAIDPRAASSGVWVEPVPHLLTGEIATIASRVGVDAARIPGYWYNRKGTTIELGHRADDGEQVFYIIHGGGFVFFSASPADWAATAPRKLLEYCPNVRRAFAIEYRLATAEPYVPVNPFPAALIDVLAGYNYLVNVVGFSPKNIIIEGDSAGGNLALALTRYLLEYQNDPVVNLPAPPGSLILLSPWADLSSSHYFPGSSALTFKSTDYLLSPSEGLSGYSKSALFGPLGPTVGKTNVYISPACLYSSIGTVSFKNFPRTYISAGGGERLLDQITTLKRLMEEDMGAGTGEGQVFYHEAPHAPHDFILYPHEPQRTNTLRSIAKWMDRTLECDSEDNRLRQSARS